MSVVEKTGFWTRMVADQTFREAVVEDPLRALARVDDVDVSPRQVRQLEEMSHADRRELVTMVVRDAFFKGAVARWGPLGDDGELGAHPPNDMSGSADQGE
jgi:hypothetical protein